MAQVPSFKILVLLQVPVRRIGVFEAARRVDGEQVYFDPGESSGSSGLLRIE